MSNVLDPVADTLVEAHRPWLYDTDTGEYLYDFEAWLRAFGGMFAQVEAYVSDRDDGTVGWGVLFDPDECPAGGLRYLGQWVGEIFDPSMPEADMRRMLKEQPNQRRGTPTGIARAVQRALTGFRTVEILVRTLPDGTPDPNGDNFLLFTYTDETPDANRVRQEILSQVPDDMVCTYAVVAGATWVGLLTGGETWSTFEAAYPTWEDAMRTRPGSSVWTW